MRTCVRMTSEGSALARFRRALAAHSGPAAYAAATELQDVELADALALTLLLSGDSDLFDRACVRWVARFALEVRGVGLREAYLAQASLSAVRPDHTVGAHSLAELCAATWRMSGGEVVLEPFGRLDRDDRAALEADAADVLRFLAVA